MVGIIISDPETKYDDLKMPRQIVIPRLHNVASTVAKQWICKHQLSSGKHQDMKTFAGLELQLHPSVA
jgi:hypothetical protein